MPEHTSPIPDDDNTIHTGGGAFIAGNVETGGGDLVGRDQYKIILKPDRPLFINVPPRPPHFLGRDALVTALVAQLCAGTTIALSAEGLPGVGKTTLAVMLAHHPTIREHFKDGVLWAGLGPTPDLDSILDAWATALGVDVTDLPKPGQRAQAVANAIGQRHFLLVIDDAWQGDPALLLRCGGPGCAHLLTTRDQAIARAFAGADHVVPVPVLDDDPAFLLLQTLAPEACASNPAAARNLAAQAGNLPLALELVGGYLAAPERSYFPDLSAKALAQLADPHRRLALAQQRLGDAAGSVVTLQQTIALSLADLPDPAVVAFHALGAFAPKPERFHRTAAQTVAETDSRTLALLIARNLLEKEDDTLALHQTLADVARSATPTAAIHRHRDHYLTLVDGIREDWQRIAAVYGQLTHAWQAQLAHAPHDEALLDFVWALRIYQERRGLRREQLDWYTAALDYARTVDHADTATLLNNMASVYSRTGQPQRALVLYKEALPIIRKMGDRHGEAVTLNNMAIVYAHTGQPKQALIHYERALLIRQEVGDCSGEATTIHNMAGVYFHTGQPQRALALYEEALPIMRQVGDRRGEAATLNGLALVYADTGQPQQALELYQQALPIIREVGDRGGETTTLNNMALMYADTGQPQQALELYQQALPIRREMGDRRGESITLNAMALAYVDTEQPQRALALCKQALPISREVGDRHTEATTLHNMGMVYDATGQPQRALALYEEALPIMREVGDRSGEASTLKNIGTIYTGRGDKPGALAYFQLALDLFESVQSPNAEIVRQWIEDLDAS